MAVRRHPVRPEAHGRPGGAEERLGRLHVPVLAQHGIDQVLIPVDRPIQVCPAAADLQVGLVDVPACPSPATRSEPALAELIAHDRQQLRLPVSTVDLLRSSTVADLDPAKRQHLAQVA